MARTGRPKAEKPFDHKVTVKFKEEEYRIMVEYAESHNLSISQLIRLGVELQMGHADVSTTMNIYAEANPDVTKSVIEKLSKNMDIF